MAALLALPWTVDRTEAPEDVLRDYLDAVIAADAEALHPHLAPPAGALDVALAAPIARAADGRLRDYTLQDVQVQGLEAVVVARLIDADGSRIVRFRLHGTSAGHFTPVRWHLEPVRLPLLDLVLPVGTSRLLVNGVQVRIPEVTWRSDLLIPRLLTLRVLPGTYRIALPTQGRPVVGRQVLIRAPLQEAFWRSGRVEVVADLQPTGVDAVTELLRDELRTCARSTIPQPFGCPFGVDLPDTVRGRWEILALPDLRCFRGVGHSFDFTGRGLVVAFTEVSGPGAEPGRVHLLRRDISASVEHRVEGYRLAAWRFTTVAEHGRAGDGGAS